MLSRSMKCHISCREEFFSFFFFPKNTEETLKMKSCSELELTNLDELSDLSRAIERSGNWGKNPLNICPLLRGSCYSASAN